MFEPPHGYLHCMLAVSSGLCYYLQVTKLKILDTLGFTRSKRPGSLKLFIEKSEIRLTG